VGTPERGSATDDGTSVTPHCNTQAITYMHDAIMLLVWRIETILKCVKSNATKLK